MAFSIPKIDVRVWLHAEFPNLKHEQYKVTSSYSDEYNCVGWAAGDTERWWWPSEDGYWPEDLPLEDTIENFIRAFQKLDYQSCADDFCEAGYEKVVLYMGTDGKVKHVARQVDANKWTSKLGQAWDIEHKTPQGVECETYGRAVQYLKRPVSEKRIEEIE